MSKNGNITVWWYERDNGNLGSHGFWPGGTPTGGSYEHEVDVKYARDAVRMVTVYPDGRGWDALQALEVEAETYRQTLGPPPERE
jgi:hypothetical protein